MFPATVPVLESSHDPFRNRIRNARNTSGRIVSGFGSCSDSARVQTPDRDAKIADDRKNEDAPTGSGRYTNKGRKSEDAALKGRRYKSKERAD